MAQLDHINMTVKNLAESIQWYEQLFNFKLVEKGLSPTGKAFGIIKNGESMLCLYETDDLNSPSHSKGVHRVYHFGLRINDRKQWEETVKREGVEIDHTWQYPHSFSWYLLDPSGYEIEVVLWDQEKIQFN